jgi:hypothetical protein
MSVQCQEFRSLQENRKRARTLLQLKLDHAAFGKDSKVGRKISKIQKQKQKKKQKQRKKERLQLEVAEADTHLQGGDGAKAGPISDGIENPQERGSDHD